jgi:hypothetical protein
MVMTPLKHVHRMAISDSGKFGMCRCGRHLEYDLEHPKNPPKVLSEGDPNFIDPAPVSKTDEKLTGPLTGTPPGDAKVKRHKGGTAMRERHKYIEDHKSEILIDVVELGTSAALKKWDISFSGWFTIRKRWGLANEGYKQAAPDKHDKPVEPVEQEEEITSPFDDIYAMLSSIRSKLDRSYGGPWSFLIEWSDLVKLRDDQYQLLMLMLRDIQQAREVGDGQRSL